MVKQLSTSRGAARPPAQPPAKPLVLIVVPSIAQIAASGSDISPTVTIPRAGIVREILLGIAHGPTTSDPWQLDVMVKMPGGKDLFNNGRAGDFCNLGLLMGGVAIVGGAPAFGGGARLRVNQRVKGNDLWTFTFRNLSNVNAVLPRAALLCEEA